jgi:D-glycero-beta-D-manno-heptose 1-phosphate adenylyltransferase
MKIVTNTSEWAALRQKIQKIKEGGKTLVFTNGCFDGLHEGHKALLSFARSQGDHVLVGLNSDSSVRALKGEGRPLYDATRRTRELLQSGYVDTVVLFDMPTPLDLICLIRPDVLVKGDDYSIETIVGAREVLQHGGIVRVFPRIPGYSTSDILHAQDKKNIETK